MIVPPHLLVIPAPITDKPLHPADGAPLDLEGHRLDRLAFQFAALPHHRVEAMRTGLTPTKTVVKGGLELPQFLHKPGHIVRHDVKVGHGTSFIYGPTGW